MTKEKIDKINELAKKSKTVGLTPEEKELQAKLRREYIDSVKRSLTSELESVVIERPDGSREQIKKKS